MTVVSYFTTFLGTCADCIDEERSTYRRAVFYTMVTQS